MWLKGDPPLQRAACKPQLQLQDDLSGHFPNIQPQNKICPLSDAKTGVFRRVLHGWVKKAFDFDSADSRWIERQSPNNVGL